MSRTDAAKRLGISKSTLSRWLGGQVLPSPDAVGRIAEFLECPEDEIATAVHTERRAREGIGQRLDRVHEKIAAMEALQPTDDPDRFKAIEDRLTAMATEVLRLAEEIADLAHRA